MSSHEKIWKALPRPVQNTLAFAVLAGVAMLVFWPYRWVVLVLVIAIAIVVGEVVRWGHRQGHSWPSTARTHIDKALSRHDERKGAVWAERMSDVKPLIAPPGATGWTELGTTEVEAW